MKIRVQSELQGDEEDELELEKEKEKKFLRGWSWERMPALQNAGNQVGEMTDYRLDRMLKAWSATYSIVVGFHVPGRLASILFARNCARRYLNYLPNALLHGSGPRATAGYRGPIDNGRLR